MGLWRQMMGPDDIELSDANRTAMNKVRGLVLLMIGIFISVAGLTGRIFEGEAASGFGAFIAVLSAVILATVLGTALGSAIARRILSNRVQPSQSDQHNRAEA